MSNSPNKDNLTAEDLLLYNAIYQKDQSVFSYNNDLG